MAGAGDRAAMDPAAVGDALRALRTAGTEFVNGWSSANSRISGLDGQLGKGPLGQAFMAGYRPGAAEIAGSADRGCRIPGQYADAGEGCVGLYTGMDGDSAAGFGAAGGHGPA
ncbi:hypothetical protein [Actinophytocola glycyrrhizae]|uniref:Excreted virulence factor EspC (Type VII ESX diderm) n=1 Tax=Actinophytocola glycyrrhizae TaxID=2044873 RepID=A0ABV9SEG3_9PSEU